MDALPSTMPGADLVRQGMADLRRGAETVESLLVSVGAGRLRDGGLPVPPPIPDADHRLYRLLARAHGDEAHSRYNALIRTLVSLERALECAS